MKENTPPDTETCSAITISAETRDLATLGALIRVCIDLAAQHELKETEHELRRALLGVHLEVPEAAALVVGATSLKPS